MASNEETNAAGTDTRPPMLVESDYDSWKIRIHRYIRGKPNGKQIWKSIQNGPTPHPMITDPPPTDSAAVPAPRKKLDSEFSEEENKLEMADTQAEIILSQGRTIQQRKEDLFDEYERFRAIGNESIHDYFVRFHKLVNDMKITQLNIPTHQMNTKFVNNLPAYWGKLTMTQIANLLSIVTEPVQRKAQVKMDNTGARGKKVIMFTTADEKEQTPMRTEIDDNTIPYHQYLLDTEAQNVPTEVSADTSDKVSMIAILTDLQTQLDGHAKVNQEKCLEIETLKNELLQCKQEICRLDTHKVKLDLENKVRQEQALVIQRNKRNAELVQENDLLKVTLSGKEKSIAFLQSEKEKILSEKEKLADSYLDEIKPKKATNDLHKDILGTRNPGLGYMAKRAQPVLYDADTLLLPITTLLVYWDNEEVLVHQFVSHKKMNENQDVRPANTLCQGLMPLFHSSEGDAIGIRRWLSANEIASQASKSATPATPFVRKSRPPSQVLASLRNVNAVFPQFEGIIKERTTQRPDYVSEWCFDYAKQFVEQQLVPFYDHFKKHIQAANDTFFKEIKEFEQIFDELEAEYEQCVLDNKNLTIEKKNLLIINECLIAECLEKDICSIVLTSDIVVPPSSNCLCEDLRSACDREHTKVLELEAEISKQKQLITESEKRFAFLEQNYVNTTASRKDDTIRKLDALINIISNMALSKNVSLEKTVCKLSKANTHSRTAYTENFVPSLLKKPAESPSEQYNSSGPSTSETPKVLHQGLSLPVKSANARKVEAHHRTLNNKNRVDSNLLVKHSVSVSKMNNVCGACNKSVVFANHTDCLVMCDGSVNVKPHQTKRFKRQPKKEWKPIKRHPLTRIMESTDQSIELPPSDSSSPKITMVSRFCNDEYAPIIGYGDYKLGDTSSLESIMLRTQAQPILSRKVDDEDLDWVRFLRTERRNPSKAMIEKFIVKTQRALNATVRFVRTDNGTEFVNKTLDGWFESVGISHETSVPRSPQQNGVVERRNRTLMEAARTMLIFAKAPLFLWAEAVATACYTLNRSLVHTLHGKTYYELLKGKKPNLQYFRVFGSLCYPTNDYDDVGKLKAKADIGIFVGYAPTKKAYRIYNKRTRKIQETVHVTLDELTKGLTSVQTSSGLAPQQMTSVPNSTELELTALQSGRSRSELVKDPEPHSIPPTKKQVDDLFPWFNDDEVIPPPAVLIPPVNAHAAQAPENAIGSPSTTVISEGV
ncbi:retrovirus-related pol polyprotein from transposon TNT 1-94 [Tanacetum coccineum]